MTGRTVTLRLGAESAAAVSWTREAANNTPATGSTDRVSPHQRGSGNGCIRLELPRIVATLLRPRPLAFCRQSLIATRCPLHAHLRRHERFPAPHWRHQLLRRPDHASLPTGKCHHFLVEFRGLAGVRPGVPARRDPARDGDDVAVAVGATPAA